MMNRIFEGASWLALACGFFMCACLSIYIGCVLLLAAIHGG